MPPFEKNGYVVACSATGEAIVIDPGDEVAQLIAIVRRTGVTVRYIMLTHSHLDHISGCNEAKAEWDVPLVLHKDDLFLYERAVQQGIAFGIRMVAQPPIDAWFDQQAHWTFGQCTVDVHHTPGHSPGQVCLQIGESGQPATRLFVGDTLFPRVHHDERGCGISKRQHHQDRGAERKKRQRIDGDAPRVVAEKGEAVNGQETFEECRLCACGLSGRRACRRLPGRSVFRPIRRDLG